MARILACSCGAVRATISETARFNRAICYCPSCQAFAQFLGRQAEILDSSGGTDVLQTQPRHIEFHQGVEKLACVRLTTKARYAGTRRAAAPRSATPRPTAGCRSSG
jgi:hypothetical protein